MKRSLIIVGVAVGASSSFAAVSPTLDVRQPLVNSTGVSGVGLEAAGPRSVVKVFVPGGLAPGALTPGQPISRARLEGLTAEGVSLGTVPISETILEAPSYDEVNGTLVTLEFSAAANLAGFFNDGDLATLRLRVTTGDRDPGVDGVETLLASGDEASDECLIADNDAPQLLAAYRDDSNVLYLVFNEAVSNGDANNSENQTNQLLITAADLQVNSEQNLFSAATPTLSGAFALISGYYDGAGRTILQFQLNADTFAYAGDYIRLAADDFGNPTHDVFRDVAGNDAFQQGEPGAPTQEGVQILGGPPPGVGGLLTWAGSQTEDDFNDPASWLPSLAPTYDKDAWLDVDGFADVAFSQPVTAVRSLKVDGLTAMSVGSKSNPGATLFVFGEESLEQVIGPALEVRDAFAAEPSPVTSFSIDEGVIDAESVAFRQDHGGSMTMGVIDTGELRAGTVRIGEPDGTSFMQLAAANGGRIVTGYDNGIGARSAQSPSVIVDRAGNISTVSGGEWLSLGDVAVNEGGQVTLASDGRAVFEGDVSVNLDGFFFAQDAIVTTQAPAEGNGAFFAGGLQFSENGLLIAERLTVEAGAELTASQVTVGVLGPEAGGVAAIEQLVAFSGSTVGATDFFSVSFDGRLRLPDFNGASPLPLNEPKAFVDIFGGTLEVQFADGFDPPLGSQFPLITAANYTGRFANHILPSFSDGRVAVVQYPVPRAGTGVVFEGPRLVITDLASLLGFDPEPVVTELDETPVRADAGDLDGDGDTDLAVVFASKEAGSVLVLRNAGTIEGVWQGFDRGVQFATGPSPTAIAIGDFTNDVPPKGQSDLDLAVVCSGDNSLRVYQNDGTGSSFEPVANEETLGFPTDVEAVDFNGDLRTDVAVVCRDADAVLVFLNAGQGVTLGGVFQAPSTVEAGDEPVDCDPVDLDNDKDVDIVTGGQSGGITSSVNDGKGGFGTSGSAATANPVDAVATGDLDSDGDMDSAVVSRGVGLLSILVNSKGSLELFSTFAVGADAGSLAIIDYDGDGDADISVVSIPEGETVHRVTVLRNDTQPEGPLVFTPSVQLGSDEEPTDPRVVYSVDVDGDGRPDVVTIDGQPTGGGGAVSSYINVSGPTPTCPGDANKDRRVDGKDLQMILGMFGQSAPAFSGPNLNGDAFVDGRDLSVLLSNYGSVCESPTSAR